ncbi:alkyl/aryl-sulfatase [Cupriavidus basilensis]|uniref:alkyl/aryl-sulfatase n=1 Tax=Cupriavidus basilensis TaxID=68895 RepID=UPI00283E0430|nr:alkyl sulfatase dimerization domain-containing protein [Cupriavidus basilensis]MDR3382524.1 alkyl sulfatase dimerization domain-containing protein [Cupriavidus basilensis]
MKNRPGPRRRLLAMAFALASAPALLYAQSAPAPGKPATERTRQANAAVLKELPFNDRADFESAQRGFIGTTPDLVIEAGNGKHAAWNLPAYDFLKAETAPDTINPSLYRMAQLNMFNGLFAVVDRVYQVRGFDLSNMTIIEGDTGLILIDPLISRETAKAALDLYYQHRPRKPVVAVIYTHSHVDHYGGVKGVVNEADVKAGKVKILAPEGFLEEAVSENIYAGTAMSRRATYMYGSLLPRGPQGQVDGGLGKSTSLGEVTLIAPTDSVTKTGETRTIDGVQMEFLMAPNTEAPAEMLIWLPQFQVLNMAEDATHTLHNLYTLRGAQVRDARQWWKTVNEAANRYGVRAKAVIAQHHWPTWGDAIMPFLENQRDMFKYLHDQTLNLANQGYTSVEIAEMLKLPGSIGKQWYNVDYYGTVNHNAKAVYQHYLGWYDSNPANLYKLPPTEAAVRYVAFMGGAKNVIDKARQSFREGDYRWVAEVMNHVVFADPDNQTARELGADALEQLAYQTESPTWRNEFLMGALELRHGTVKLPGAGVVSADTVNAMTADMILDYAGIRLNGKKAAGKTLNVNWINPQTNEQYAIELRNSVLIYTVGKQLPKADVTITTNKLGLASVLGGATTLSKLSQAGGAKVEGAGEKFDELAGMLDTFKPDFNIVTP